MAKQSSRQRRKVAKTMREYKSGDLHSGSKRGPKVRDAHQAIAIALRQAGVPKKR